MGSGEAQGIVDDFVHCDETKEAAVAMKRMTSSQKTARVVTPKKKSASARKDIVREATGRVSSKATVDVARDVRR